MSGSASGSSRSLRSVSARIFTQLLLVIGALLILGPLALMLLSSVKSNSDIYADPWGINLDQFRWDNYATAVVGPPGGQSMLLYYSNTLIVALVSLAAAMVIGAVAGYALAQSSSRLTAFLDRYFLVLLTVPIFVAITPIFTLMGALGLRNNIFGLALVYAATMLPPTIILCRAYFMSFPVEVLDAAHMDGLTSFGTITRIVLPMSAPSLVGIFMVNLIWVWSELLLALALQIRPESKTLPLGILAFKGQWVTELGVQFAALVLSTAPLFILYAIFSRRMTDAMAAGVGK